MWRNANAVCFDVDSTVCVDEGIDELAEFCGAGEAVAEWTARFSGFLFIIISLFLFCRKSCEPYNVICMLLD